MTKKARAPDFYRIRRSIIGYATVGALVIAILSSIAAVAPMYGSLRESASLNLIHEAETTAQSFGEYVRRVSSVSLQISNRTRSRQRLSNFHDEDPAVEKDRASSFKTVNDAVKDSEDVAGLARLNAAGVPLVEVGIRIPRSTWPARFLASDTLRYSGPVTVDGELYVVVSSPIYDRSKTRIGTDVILYRAASLARFLRDEFSFRRTEASFLVFAMNGERMLLTQAGGAEESASAQTRIGSYRDALAAKQVPDWDAVAAKTGIGTERIHAVLQVDSLLFASAPVAGSGWVILLRVDAAEVYAGLNRQIQTTVVAVLALTLFGALGIYFLVHPLASVMQREIEAKTSDLEGELRERRRAEDGLRESQATLRTVIDAVPACIEAKDPTGRYVFVNAYQAALTGINPDQAAGRSRDDMKGNGHEISVRAADEEIIRTREPQYNHEVVSRSAAGETRYWLSNKVPVTDGHGNIELLVTVSLDITKRKEAEAEKEALEQELRRSQKLESLGTLAGGVAHEINTPSQYVGDNLRFLQSAFKAMAAVCDKAQALADAAKAPGAPAPEVAALEVAVKDADLDYYLSEIPASLNQSLDGIERIREIVSAIKSFSHPDVKEKVAIDIHEAIKTTITVTRNQWKHVAELDTDFDAAVAPLACLPGEFNQVILNLIVNAAQAIEEAGKDGPGKITISTRTAGHWTEIRVADNGSGIEPENVERIFDMFYTTKGPGKGTGQGLAICHTIVTKKHGGTISVESKDGRGTTFIVRLPAADTGEDLQAAG